MRPITDYVLTREPNACVCVALANYLGHSYNDVLRAIVKADVNEGRVGLSMKQTKRTAELLGSPLRFKSKVNLHKDYGILWFSDHATMLRNGLVFEGNGDVIEVDHYLRVHYPEAEKLKGLLYYQAPKPKKSGTIPSSIG